MIVVYVHLLPKKKELEKIYLNNYCRGTSNMQSSVSRMAEIVLGSWRRNDLITSSRRTLVRLPLHPFLSKAWQPRSRWKNRACQSCRIDLIFWKLRLWNIAFWASKQIVVHDHEDVCCDNMSQPWDTKKTILCCCSLKNLKVAWT